MQFYAEQRRNTHVSWHVIDTRDLRSVHRRMPQFRIVIARRARVKLIMLNQARELVDLRIPPANRLEALSGDRAGQYSIRVNDQWRICFVWRAGSAERVEFCDYN